MIDESQKSETAKKEETILAFWNKEKIFEKTLKKKAPKGEFVFYDGPPFATGLPHSGSLLSSVIKDVIPRYKTMRGHHVRRRWGWDTHGLPIESLVEKKLGLKTKKDILDIGIAKFNETARGMVLEYVDEWKKYVERVGRWVDFDNSYKTMDNTYIESVWWALKEIHKKKKLYEGNKVLMYCPHCETPLAKAEIAMDNTYQDVTEEAVTVKFKIKEPEAHGLPQNTYFLAWTTTPWTLPGNVALAVGVGITYVLVERESEKIILAKERFDGAGDIIKEYPGEDLIGIEYEPLYAIKKVLEHEGKKHVILPAGFVTTEEGTGIVHTAVMYGEDDFALGQKENLPMVQLLDASGKYNNDAPEFLRGKYIKDAERDIKKDLEARGLLFEKKNHTHSYPHCYRCGTPLIYNAVSSWFIDIQSVKQKMLSENENINWVPEHLKHGRFKHIVENAPDWTISRNRFWASPLPIWKKKDGTPIVIGSLDELKKHTKKSGNRYFIMRHGESEKNVKDIISYKIDDKFHLTDKGKQQAHDSAQNFKNSGITRIYSSPLLRAKETSDIAAHVLGVPSSAVAEDVRLIEYNHGIFDKRTEREWWEAYPDSALLFEQAPESAETINDMRHRFGEFLYEIENKHRNENILIVSHEWPLLALLAVSKGANRAQTAAILNVSNPRDRKPEAIHPGEIREFPFIPLPHNDLYELDLHRPYIDDVVLVDERGEPMTRIPEVVDCWVESGSMPFAEYHYPFENRNVFEKRAPGDFIAEYIAQTRTWFYYTHTLGVLLFGRRAFKNVVTTGNILAADGSKMSKSKQNYSDPYELFDRYGADAFRYYLISSVVMQAEDFNFKDEDLKDAHNRVVNILRNTLTFYRLYEKDAPEPSEASTNILDRWILARLNEVTKTATTAFDRFDTIRATRPFRDFIDDFSTWYVRRSRERIKGSNAEDKRAALGTMRSVLREFSKIIAPVMPFIADEIYRGVKIASDPESVHLAEWPQTSSAGFDLRRFFSPTLKAQSSKLIQDMAEVRRVVSLGLEKRAASGIKVRQPLGKLSTRSRLAVDFGDTLIKDEVNVKEIIYDHGLPEDVVLDTHMTEELKEEGLIREFLRAVQDARKKGGLSPNDTAALIVGAEHSPLVEKHWDKLRVPANLVSWSPGEKLDVKRP